MAGAQGNESAHVCGVQSWRAIMRKGAFALASLIALAGCQTAYQSRSWMGGTGGYTDRVNPDGSFYVESLTNMTAGPELALTHWHRRAAELCMGRPYKSEVQLTSRLTNNRPWPLAKGTATCQ